MIYKYSKLHSSRQRVLAPKAPVCRPNGGQEVKKKKEQEKRRVGEKEKHEHERSFGRTNKQGVLEYLLEKSERLVI
jgi:hypothetical protein